MIHRSPLGPRAFVSRPLLHVVFAFLVGIGHAHAAGLVPPPTVGAPSSARASSAELAPLHDSAVTAAPVAVIDDRARPVDVDAPWFSATQAPGSPLERRVGATHHVAPTASGDGSGSSWANASGDLQAMLDAAVAGDQIWVAAGVHRPGPGGDRTVSFVLKDGVAVYGGFAGNEAPGFDLGLRDFVANETILSGDLLGDDGQQPVETDPLTNTNTSDNAYTVVDASGVGVGTLLDGLTITAGNADLLAPSPDPGIRGAGVFMNTGTLTVSNCRFVGGYAGIDFATGELGGGGAGIYVLDGALFVSDTTFTGCAGGQGAALFGSGANLDLDFCTFDGNRVSSIGGAVVSSGTLTIRDSAFTGNSATASVAGAIYTDGVLVVERTSFTANLASMTSDGGGGAIYAPTFTGPASATIRDCSFVDNVAGNYGGAVFGSDVPFTIRGTNFEGNDAGYRGGAVYLQNATAEESLVDDCTFTGNTVGSTFSLAGGGGIATLGAPLLLTNSTFTGNDASVPDQGQIERLGGGGAVYTYSNGLQLVTIEACDFIGNTATFMNGGAIHGVHSRAIVRDCSFQDNVATYWGGAVVSFRNNLTPTPGPASWLVLTGCDFEGNDALYGGGIMTWFSHVRVERSRFLGNTTRLAGGALSFAYDGSSTVDNSIIAANAATVPGASGAAGIFVSGASTPRFTHVTITGNTGSLGAAVYQTEANSNASFLNSIVSGNPSEDGTPFVNATDLPGATGAFTHSLIEGNVCPPGVDCGTGVILGDDPLFVGPADFHLQPASPAIDTGTNDAGLTIDIDGNPRALIVGDRADMGAYEFDGVAIFDDCNDNGLPDLAELFGNPTLDCNGNGVLDQCEGEAFAEVTGLAMSGNAVDLSLHDDMVYVADDADREIVAVRLVGASLTPQVEATISTQRQFFIDVPRSVIRVGDSLYVGTDEPGGSNGALLVIGVSDLQSPSTPFALSEGQPVGRFDTSQGLLFVPTADPGSFGFSDGLLEIWRTDGSSQPVVGVEAGTRLNSVLVVGSRVFTTGQFDSGSLATFEFTGGPLPSLNFFGESGVPQVSTGAAALGPDASGFNRVVVVGDQQLQVFNYLDSNQPAYLQTAVFLPSPANAVVVQGTRAYVATDAGLLVYSLPGPTDSPTSPPVLVDQVNAPTPFEDVVILSGRLLVAAGSAGLRVFDVPSFDTDGNGVLDECGVATSVPSAGTAFALHAAAPNPFNPKTTIRFDLPVATTVRLTIHDASGRVVRTLVRDTFEAGRHAVVWSGRDDRGSRVASGVYYSKIEADGFVQSRRMTLLK